MADRFLNRLPLASLIMSRTGQLTGLPEHAARLLRDERLLLVFPEGVRGTAKLFSERREVKSFPAGFMRLAMQTQTPIVPVGILGAGEALPTVANLERLGRAVGVPYLPLTPYLLPIPLPARFELYFGEPLVYAGSGDEEGAVQSNVERVRESIQSLVEMGARSYRAV
jgi:1-acyl-sn-glycerol-3-phosphate acyltransferase